METPTPTETPVVAPAGEETSPAAPSPAEPTTSAPAEPAVESPPAEEPPVSSAERQPRPAQRRIQELVQQNKQLKEQLVTAPVAPQAPQPPKLSDLVQGKEQIMPDELDKLGQEAYTQGAQSVGTKTALEVAQLRQEMVIRDAINETDKVASTLHNEFSELNPKDPGYSQALEKKIIDRYQQAAVRQGPNGQKFFDTSVKLADIAKEEVEFYREATEAGKAKSSEALASQADQAALTPSGAPTEPEKAFDQMTLKEQEAYLRAKGHDI